jgi:DHA1 family bicyclomycin/chloramphenicol resistance-like MFS transporter
LFNGTLFPVTLGILVMSGLGYLIMLHIARVEARYVL